MTEDVICTRCQEHWTNDGEGYDTCPKCRKEEGENHYCPGGCGAKCGPNCDFEPEEERYKSKPKDDLDRLRDKVFYYNQKRAVIIKNLEHFEKERKEHFYNQLRLRRDLKEYGKKVQMYFNAVFPLWVERIPENLPSIGYPFGRKEGLAWIECPLCGHGEHFGQGCDYGTGCECDLRDVK